MGRGGLNIWHEYRLFCGSTQWLLVQTDTYAVLYAALQNTLLNNKNAVLLTPKFALSFVKTSKLFSKLLQSRMEHFNHFQPIPRRKLSNLSRFSSESSAEQFCSYTAHILKYRVPVLQCISKQLSGLTERISSQRWKIWILFSIIYPEQHQLKRLIFSPPKWHTALSPSSLAPQAEKAFLKYRGPKDCDCLQREEQIWIQIPHFRWVSWPPGCWAVSMNLAQDFLLQQPLNQLLLFCLDFLFVFQVEHFVLNETILLGQRLKENICFAI